MLLDDTIQCPNCDEMLDQNLAVQTESNEVSSTSEDSPDRPCPECGEMVRTGLVRCWNCSTFMRSEIAALYQQMQSTDRPVIYSQPQMDHEDFSSLEDAEEVVAGDQEFELSSEFRLETSSPSKKDSTNSVTKNTVTKNTVTKDTVTKKETATDESNQNLPDEKSNGMSSKENLETATSESTQSDDETQAFMNEFVTSRSSKSNPRSNPGNGKVVDGVRVYCPNGHRIIVQERHRGLTGRCPKCKSSFVVPGSNSGMQDAESTEREQQDDSSIAGKFQYWVHDVIYHEINPERLRLKAGSMKKNGKAKDLGFSEDTLLIVSLDKKGGTITNRTKANEIRSQIHQHLKENGKLEKVPVGSCESISLEQFKKSLKIVLPAENPEDSMFAGIPVFGEGRVVVRIPAKRDSKELRFLSLSLSTYRQLHKILTSFFGMTEFGSELDIPLKDEFREFPCFYSSEMVRFFKHGTDYQQADPAYKLKRVGRQCSHCKMVVSEEARKKEKFGGSGGKALAKTNCPKCQNLFGTVSIYDIDSFDAQPVIEETENDE